MKTVFSSLDETIHAYAQQDQNEGRNSSGTVFFYKTKLYSYGHHYLMCEFITAADGARAVMINDKGYSSSTSRHISITQGATRQHKQFYTTETEFVWVRNQLKAYLRSLSNARKPELYILPANDLFNKFVAFQEWTGGRRKGRAAEINELKKIIEAINGDIGDIKEYYKKVDEKRAAETRKKARAAAAAAAEQIKKFYNHEVRAVYGLYNEVLRISKDGANVETSQGVKIDARECRILYRAIQAGENVRGYKIDNYTVLSCNGVLTVGCHKITKEEINKIAKKLNWI